MNQHTALILGASGLTGSHLLQLLLNDPQYSSITIYVRKPVEISHPKLVQQVIDYETLETTVNADHVFCCLGTTIAIAGSQEAFTKVDVTYPLKVARLQVAAGSQHFLLISAVGASDQSPIFYSRTKGVLEAALKQLGYPSLSIFQPSFIVGKRQEKRWGEEIGTTIARLLSPLLMGPLRKYQPVSALAIARAMQYTAHQQQLGWKVVTSDQIKQFE